MTDTPTSTTDPTTAQHAAPPAGQRVSLVRIPGPDVTRAVALIGVVVMNYHGYLNGSQAVAQPGDSFATRLFDPWTGVLSTRFAASFMLVAGVGVTLLTERSRTSRDRAAITAERWRLIRRGALLYGFGFVLDWIWPGTILFFYGAAFVIAGLIFHLRTRWIATIGAVSALGGATLHWWAAARAADSNAPDWLLSPGTLGTRSPRGLLFDTFVNGTHPLLPWMAFMCAGIVIGRHLRNLPLLRVGAAAAVAVAVSYTLNHVLSAGHAGDTVRLALVSTSPFDRGLLYTANALGTAVVALCAVTWICRRVPESRVLRVLQVAGQTTLSLYVLHVLVFNVVVNQLGVVRHTGLDTALVFALVFWLIAIALAWMWHDLFGRGPLEVLYRRFGG